MAYLYRHIRLDKYEPFYIGIGSDEDFKRAYDKNNRNTHWRNIVNKTAYEVEIVMEGLSWEEACKKEIEFIKLYGRSDLKLGTLCNLTEGGEGVLGMTHSQETKNKISQDNKRPEKAAICMINYKKMTSPESIAKAKASRDYNEISRKRVLNTDYNKIKEASEKSVLQYDLNGNFIKKWKSITKASNDLNIASPNITKCCKGKRNYAGEFIWFYYTGDIKSTVPPIKTRKKEVFKYDLFLNFIEKYESVNEASRQNKVATANIAACCNKKVKSAGGFIWSFNFIN
jgi:hypothetical protein